VTVPTSWLARFCSLRPLVFTGRISYGLYLYHWPLFLVIDHAHTGLLGIQLLAARLVASFTAAIASFYLVEEPIRSGRAFRGMRGLALTGAAALGTAAALVVATVAPVAAAGAAQQVAGVSSAIHAVKPPTPTPGAPTAAASGPVRFLLVGDSVAMTMGMGLGVDDVSRYGVDELDEGALGCDLDDVDVNLNGQVGAATPGCVDWWSTWSGWVSTFHPDVVGLEIGRWEVSDHLYQGRWVHVGDPAWDAHLIDEIDVAVNVFTAGVAKVVLFTMPYMDPSVEAANGTPFSENDPGRATAFNRLLERVARQRSSQVTLVDVNKILDPDGRYQAVVDGLTVRTTDGIHITEPGGEWLQSRILPTVAELGLEARTAAGPTGAKQP
jgi:hypothetical protein